MFRRTRDQAREIVGRLDRQPSKLILLWSVVHIGGAFFF